MEIFFMPFQIGEEYENWEFDLECTFNDSPIYDEYLYIKGDITELFQVPVEKIYLYFNLDILFQVKYEFKGKYFQELKNILLDNLSDKYVQVYEDKQFWKGTDVVINFLCSENKVYLNMIDKKYSPE